MLRLKYNKGFTLLEMIITIIILAVLSIMIPIMLSVMLKSTINSGQIKNACSLASRELSLVKNTNYSTLAPASFSPYAGSDFDLIRGVASLLLRDTNGVDKGTVKKVTISVSPHGSTNKLVELVSYISDISFEQNPIIAEDDFLGNSLNLANWTVSPGWITDYTVSNSCLNLTPNDGLVGAQFTWRYQISGSCEISYKFKNFVNTTEPTNSNRFMGVRLYLYIKYPNQLEYWMFRGEYVRYLPNIHSYGVFVQYNPSSGVHYIDDGELFNTDSEGELKMRVNFATPTVKPKFYYNDAYFGAHHNPVIGFNDNATIKIGFQNINSKAVSPSIDYIRIRRLGSYIGSYQERYSHL